MKNKKSSLNKKAFTLVEMLVVVLIIGILAAIAVPQYQKAVLKAELHKGVNLVESIYQAQQAYYLAHGEFATDLADIDITLPASCTKNPSAATEYSYSCDFGAIYSSGFQQIYFITQNDSISYVRYLIDKTVNTAKFKANHSYCYARPSSQTAQDVCVNMGGTFIGQYGNVWKYYALD